jgi:hypothetical protein
MPQRQHCPPAKRRGDRNPECHEEQQKDSDFTVSLYSKISYKKRQWRPPSKKKKEREKKPVSLYPIHRIYIAKW